MASNTHLNVCEVANPVLTLARWTGILPLEQCNCYGNHINNGCHFEISKFWRSVSIFIQILYIPFVILLLLDISLTFSTANVLRNALKFMLITHEVELYGVLLLGILYSRRLSNVLNKMSRIPSSAQDMMWIGRFIRGVLIFLVSFFIMYSSSTVTHALMEFKGYFAIRNFYRCLVGVILHTYLMIYTQIQCMLNVTLCLLICSKFKYLANNIKVTLNKKSVPVVSQKVIIVKTSETTDKTNTFQIQTDYLEYLHKQYCDISNCLDEINSCIGFQLLLAVSVILYTLIYFLFCEISVEGYNNNIILVSSSIFGTVVISIRMTLLMWVGHKIKVQTMEPLKALQHSQLLHQPQHIQQQVQTLLLQWSTNEPGYLSAFNIMNVGPWLLTPIIGNVITYLLVFIQISNNSKQK